MITKNGSYRDFGATRKLNFSYYRIISMFWQIYIANVPKQTIFRDCSVYSGIIIRQSNKPFVYSYLDKKSRASFFPQTSLSTFQNSGYTPSTVNLYHNTRRSHYKDRVQDCSLSIKRLTLFYPNLCLISRKMSILFFERSHNGYHQGVGLRSAVRVYVPPNTSWYQLTVVVISLHLAFTNPISYFLT